MKRIITKKYAQVGEMVDMSARPIPMPPRTKKILQDGIRRILAPSRFDIIPLQDIFYLLSHNFVMPLQEDGTKWSGILVGGAECGSEEAADQDIQLPLAVRTEMGWQLTKAALRISWCELPSGKIEVTGYLAV